MEKNNKKQILFHAMIIMILLGIIVYVLSVYENVDYHDFIKTECIAKKSNFTRDKNVKFENAKYNSYKIESDEYNDAMFYKEIPVEKDTPYKITCMVKTENVETEDNVSNAGAQISIADTVEKSKSISGTNDWQLIELDVDSKNRTNLEVGFRLGGNDGNCKGTAWFSNFTIEKGLPNTNTDWNFACFIFDNTDLSVEYNKNTYNLKATMSNADNSDIKTNMQRFKSSCENFSNNNMNITYDIIHIKEPLTSLSYSDDCGFYVSPKDVKKQIDTYLKEQIYDHIFVIFRTGTVEKPTPIKLNNWIGLGSMDYDGIGFSEVQLVDDDNNYIFRYNDKANIFPEEVLLHEFLHTLERQLTEDGYTFPALHDNEKYGYIDQKLIGLREWYKVYMACKVQGKDGYKTGLDSKVYKMKPVNSENFTYTTKLTSKYFKEAQNVFEEIGNILKTVRVKMQGKNTLTKTNTVTSTN